MSFRTLYIQILFSISFSLLYISCKSGKTTSATVNTEEKYIVDLIGKVKGNPRDRQSADELEAVYGPWVDRIRESPDDVKKSIPERSIARANALEPVKRVYEAISSSPAVMDVISNPYDPSAQIVSLKESAAKDYYNQGMNYLSYNNRIYAEKAYQEFQKADRIVPGYADVRQRMTQAQQLSQLTVAVRPVNYNNNPFSYWGFTNDYLQNRMVMDLNTFSGRNTRFVTEWEAGSRRLSVDKYVDLQFRELFVGPVNSRTQTFTRTAEVQSGSTNSIPSKPVFQTVTANLYITTRTMVNNAVLEMRIIDRATGRITYTDRYPGNYTWKSETATYKGDRRALTQEDLRLISNSVNQIPNRNETANRLINECYNLMISRIKTGVQFQ